MNSTMEYTGTLAILTCWCGIKHAVPSSLRNHQMAQHRDGKRVMSIYCPLGHEHIPSGKGEADKLRDRLNFERDRSARLAAQRDQAEASRRAQKAATTRARKRHAAGVCPACKRTFQNVQQHMASQHPEFDPSAS